MASFITPQGFADCSEVQPEERLLVGTTDGGILYLDPRKDPKTEKVWYPVVELEHCTLTALDKMLAPCRATACGNPEIKLISEPRRGAALSFWVEHTVHGSPQAHTIKGLTICQLDVITIHDIMSLSMVT